MRPEMENAVEGKDWSTPNEVDDPKDLPPAVGWKILVRVWTPPEKTKGGILLPDQVIDDREYLTTVGRVVSVGPLAWRAADAMVDGVYTPWAKKGEYVVFGKFAGEKLRYGGVKYILLDDKNIKWVVKDPSKLMNF